MESQFISCVTGEAVKPAALCTSEFWISYLLKSTSTLLPFTSQLSNTWLEVGTTTLLPNLMRNHAHLHQIDHLYVPSCTGTQNTNKGTPVDMLCGAGKLFVAGYDINWSSLLSESTTKYTRVALPHYPFERKQYWLQQQHIQQRAPNKPQFHSPKLYTTHWLNSGEYFRDAQLPLTLEMPLYSKDTYHYKCDQYEQFTNLLNQIALYIYILTR